MDKCIILCPLCVDCKWVIKLNFTYNIEFFFERISKFVWGPSVLFFLLVVGLYFTIGTKWLQFSQIPTVVKKTIGSLFQKSDNKDGITPFQAVNTALAGTMGTGNIAGVATAIVAGGPGAVFWMWISAFVGMATKYAEVLLAVHFRTKDKNGKYTGGPMYYMQNGVGSSFMAVVFSFLTVVASFGIGNMSQINSVAQGAASSFGVPEIVVGIVFAVLLGFVIMGGINRIGKVAESVIPLFSILYILGAFVVILKNQSMILPVFKSIFYYAFNSRAAVGGVAGFSVMEGMRYGIARGVFSNEAGLGSAPIAHACADTNSSVEQGFWGIFEVFTDTILCCTLTTLVILTADGGKLWESGLNGAELTSKAFELAFGKSGSSFVAVSMVFFAFVSMLGWFVYGERSSAYLFGENSKAVTIYKYLFLLAAVFGAVSQIEVIWSVSDALNGLMMLPNIAAILILSKTVFAQTDKYFAMKYLKDKKSKKV